MFLSSVESPAVTERGTSRSSVETYHGTQHTSCCSVTTGVVFSLYTIEKSNPCLGKDVLESRTIALSQTCGKGVRTVPPAYGPQDSTKIALSYDSFLDRRHNLWCDSPHHDCDRTPAQSSFPYENL